MAKNTLAQISAEDLFDEAELLFADMPEFGDQHAETAELERLELPIWAQDALDQQDQALASGV